MRRFLLAPLFCLALLAPDVADATYAVYWYGGIHPFPAGYAMEFCYEERLHGHSTPPIDPYVFGTVDEVFYFIGDPVPWGVDLELVAVHPFHGHHPLPMAFGGGYCYLSGHHYHHWAPRYLMVTGWYWDTGWIWYGGFTSSYYLYVDVWRTYYGVDYCPPHPTRTVVITHRPPIGSKRPPRPTYGKGSGGGYHPPGKIKGHGGPGGVYATPVPPRTYSAKPVPPRTYSAKPVPPRTYSAKPVPPRTYSAKPVPPRTYSAKPVPPRHSSPPSVSRPKSVSARPFVKRMPLIAPRPKAKPARAAPAHYSASSRSKPTRTPTFRSKPASSKAWGAPKSAPSRPSYSRSSSSKSSKSPGSSASKSSSSKHGKR